MRKFTESASSLVIGSRISLIRRANKYSQSDLALLLSDLTGSRKSPMLISHWENGRRVPDEKTISLFADYFNVTEEYLRGYTDDPQSTETERNEVNIRLKPEDYGKFDGKVVYLAFENYEHEDQPAIVNYQKHSFIVKDGKIPFMSESIRAVYVSEPDYMRYKSFNGMHPIDMATLLDDKNNLFWVEMKSPDAIVRTRYNGWYRRSEKGFCLVSETEGYVLPFEGLNLSYYAYVGKDTIRKTSGD